MVLSKRNDTDSAHQRFAVLQAGARMHYAVPALLARAGALTALYTDVHANHRHFRWLEEALPARWQPKAVKRLLARKLPSDLPLAMVCDHPFLGPLISRFGEVNDASVLATAAYYRFGGANSLYTNFINNDISLVRRAKDQGLKIVHELIIGADVGRIMLEERARFPGVEPAGESVAEVESGIARDKVKWQLCDQVLVPSEYCRDSSIALGCDPSKISVVPYGLEERWFELQASPVPGRILFVGQVGLRKGNQYLAAACRLLGDRKVAFECRVVGPHLVNTENSIFKGPHYLGQIPRSKVYEEFQSADIFVLPTIADSFGLVHLEAMACGVPVITTPHCGSIIRDGIDGFIVPIRDTNTLTERLLQLIEDRALRDRMGRAAKERAREYTWAHYGDRLMRALRIGASP